VTEELTNAVIDLREDDALALVDHLLAGGADPAGVLDSCKNAMDVIGERFACGEAFIPELIMAGEIMQEVSARLKPHLVVASVDGRLGTVALGTASGDIHDIGKDIVATMLGIAGFGVIDLGVDVPPEKFVAAARDGADVVAMSCLLTNALESMKDTVAALSEAGVRGKVRVMVGGAPVNEQVRQYAGADGWGKDAIQAVELATTWLKRSE
jgi:trimethylamine corrinoid protein